MKKLLTCLLVVGALALTAEPAQAAAYQTLWQSPKLLLAGRIFTSDDPGCQGTPACRIVWMRVTNKTDRAQRFECYWTGPNWNGDNTEVVWDGTLPAHAHRVYPGPVFTTRHLPTDAKCGQAPMG